MSNERVAHLIATYNTGGYEAAQITHKTGLFYTTELEDIGPMYLMDDFGQAVMVSIKMLGQCLKWLHD
jgi:hypothetical protein